jgi:lipid-A-disaccharide synthase
MDIVLVANSPGELSALVKPLAEKFKEKARSARLILFITPCQYASGREVEFAQKILKVDQIISTEEYKKWLLTGPLPYTPHNLGVVLFLGGDLLHATLIAKKLNYKAYAYLAGKHIGWRNVFSRFFVPDDSLFKNEEKAKVVGDLMTDSIQVQPREKVRNHWHLKNDRLTLAFMPGSRHWEIAHMLPLYRKIIKILKSRIPELQLMLILSPFITVEDIEKYPEHSLFDVLATFDSISAADLAVTIPGTNTAQIASAGIPMLVLFPLDNPEVIPLEGIMHYLTSIPLLGYFLKRLIAFEVNRKTKYFALPNIKAGREIVPEMRGSIKPKEAAEKIINLLSHPSILRNMEKELSTLMVRSGAANKIVEDILNETLS